MPRSISRRGERPWPGRRDRARTRLPPSGQLSAEPLAYADHALETSVVPWTAIGSAGAVPTPLPQGEMAPGAAAAAAALDAAIHAWDIAMATGQGSPLTPELARALLPVARSIVEPLRAYGAYAQALETRPGALDDAVLLCYLGRRPARRASLAGRGASGGRRGWRSGRRRAGRRVPCRTVAVGGS